MPWTVGKVEEFYYILINGGKMVNVVTKEPYGHIIDVGPGRSATELWVRSKNLIAYGHPPPPVIFINIMF